MCRRRGNTFLCLGRRDDLCRGGNDVRILFHDELAGLRFDMTGMGVETYCPLLRRVLGYL